MRSVRLSLLTLASGGSVPARNASAIPFAFSFRR
jgi:hypothetical protein